MKKLKVQIVFMILLLSIAMPSTSFSQERTIQVTGSSEMDIMPDEVEFLIGIREYFEEEFIPGKEYKDYQTKVPIKKIEDELMAKLKIFGINKTDITIENVGNYWRSEGKSFQMSKRYSFKITDFKLIDRLVTELDVRGMDYMQIGELKNKQLPEKRKQVKIDALKAAKEKAEYLLAGLGKLAGDVIQIKEINNDNSFQPVMFKGAMSNSMAGGEGDGATSIRKINIRYEIEATFLIK